MIVSPEPAHKRTKGASLFYVVSRGGQGGEAPPNVPAEDGRKAPHRSGGQPIPFVVKEPKEGASHLFLISMVPVRGLLLLLSFWQGVKRLCSGCKGFVSGHCARHISPLRKAPNLQDVCQVLSLAV